MTPLPDGGLRLRLHGQCGRHTYALNGGVPFTAGAQPSSIASAPGGNVIYVTDSANNDVLVYSANSGLLTALSGSPFPAGNAPAAVVVDAIRKSCIRRQLAGFESDRLFIATAGLLSSLGDLHHRNATSGDRHRSLAEPVHLHGEFSRQHGLRFSGQRHDGTLLNSQYSPYRANAKPTAVAAIPHGKPKT